MDVPFQHKFDVLCTYQLQDYTFTPLHDVSLHYNVPIGNMDDTKVPRSELSAM